MQQAYWGPKVGSAVAMVFGSKEFDGFDRQVGADLPGGAGQFGAARAGGAAIEARIRNGGLDRGELFFFLRGGGGGGGSFFFFFLRGPVCYLPSIFRRGGYFFASFSFVRFAGNRLPLLEKKSSLICFQGGEGRHIGVPCSGQKTSPFGLPLFFDFRLDQSQTKVFPLVHFAKGF